MRLLCRLPPEIVSFLTERTYTQFYSSPQSVQYALNTQETLLRPHVQFLFEIYITALTINKAVQHALVLKRASVAPVLHIMFRDGIFYFIAIAISRVGLVWLVLAKQSVFFGETLLLVFSILPTHLASSFRSFTPMGDRGRISFPILYPFIGNSQQRPTPNEYLDDID